MYLAGIQRDSIVDGIGIRDVIFFQGCDHHCEGCHNPETWAKEPPNKWVGWEYVLDELKDTPNNITFSGGEPLIQWNDMVMLGRNFKKLGKTVWCYTGFTYEDLPHQLKAELATAIDVLVDGKFIKELADKSLLFRGSSNQRIILVQSSLDQLKTVEWGLEDEFQ